jgi:ABC-type branched-subunit amino acid transport system substrate-binding protein
MDFAYGLFRRRLTLLALVLLAAVVVAAACGDDEDEGDQLKIAFLADFSGPLAEFGPVIQTGVELAIKHVNDAGGVNGRDVVLVTGDTQLDTTAAVEEARRLVDIEGVHAIVGPLSSTVTIAVAESVTGDAGVPTITPSGTSPGVSIAVDNGYLFRSTVSDAAQGPVLADLASGEGFDNLAVLFINDAYGQGLADALEGAWSGTITKSSFEDGQASYLAELQQVADGGAEVLVAIGFPTQAEVFIREALENDIFSKFLFVDGTKSEDLIAAIGAANLEGFKGTAPVGAESEALAAWDAAYLEEYGELPTRPFVREAYDATIAIALAAEVGSAAGRVLSRDALVRVTSPGGVVVIPGPDGIEDGLKAVRDGEDVNYEGAATTLDWNNDGDVTSGVIGTWQYAGGSIVELDKIPFTLD